MTDTTECENCGKQRYTFEACQHCGHVHWRE
jgi:rRNA maturation protein Nop10